MSLPEGVPGRPDGEAEAYARLEARVGRADMTRCDGCSQCAVRCVDGLELTYPEFTRLMKAAAKLPPDQLRRVLAQPKGIPGWEETAIRLCPLLDRDAGRCLVYPARPLICRLMGTAPWLPCPHGVCEPFPEALDIMLAYADLERHTLEEWSRRTGLRLST